MRVNVDLDGVIIRDVDKADFSGSLSAYTFPYPIPFLFFLLLPARSLRTNWFTTTCSILSIGYQPASILKVNEGKEPKDILAQSWGKHRLIKQTTRLLQQPVAFTGTPDSSPNSEEIALWSRESYRPAK
jgi:hypothetical protein